MILNLAIVNLPQNWSKFVISQMKSVYIYFVEQLIGEKCNVRTFGFEGVLSL